MNSPVEGGALHLACVVCTQQHDLAPLFRGCPACGGQLDLRMEDAELASCWEARNHGRAAGTVVPGVLPVEPVTRLGEGGTPLVPTTLDDGTPVHVKFEGTNPTGSFKDRMNAASTAMLVRLACSGVVASSTGNQALSAATYAAAAGLRARVLLPYEAPPRFASDVQATGADTRVVAWGDRGAQVEGTLDEPGWGYSGRNWPRPVGSPFGIEGYRSIAHEVFDQLRGLVPTHVFMPSCGGDGIAGVAKGFADLVRLGLAERVPVLVGCQTLRSTSALRAFETGADVPEAVPLQWSVALSLVDERAGGHGLAAVRSSGGWFAGFEEHELVQAVGELARRGIGAEPAGAAAWAGLRAWRRERAAGAASDARAVAVVTGSSARWPAASLAAGTGVTGAGDPRP